MTSLERMFDPSFLTRFVPFSIVVIFGTGSFAGIVKMRLRVRTNYTRKLFHFVVFTFAGVSAVFGGVEAVFVYGGVAGIYVMVALLWNGGHAAYEGIAREEDAPHRSLYVLIPFLATAVAGILGNVWFGSAALAGYVVAGWGDAAGEPIGVSLGRHPYRVPALFGTSKRTVEGSFGVLLASFAAVEAIAALALAADWVTALPRSFLVALAVTLVEAVTPRGLDNLTTQLTATGLAAVLLRLP